MLNATLTACVIFMSFSNLPSSQAYSLLVTDPVGTAPYSTTFDPNTGNIYVANDGDNTVSMINATNGVITIPVGTGPLGVAAGNGNIYVANSADNTISVISDATNTVTNTISVGSSPIGVAFDSATGNVYVANYGDNTVSVVNGATNTVTRTVSVGTNPYGVDIGKGNAYVANYGSNTVSVISDATNTVTSTISGVSSPTWLTFDPANGNLYVADSATNAVSVISTAVPISKSSTSTTITSSQNPSVADQVVTLTAGVSPSTATGTIQFSIDGAAAGSPVTIIGGYAPITLSTLSAGTHQITATYSGDTNDADSTVTMTQTVNQAITTTVVTSSQNPSVAGQSINFTASVSPSTATGTIQFSIDGAAAGSPVTIIGGHASMTSSTLSIGVHQITATYSGDTNDASSTSATITQTMNILATKTTTTITSSQNPSVADQVVTLTAGVSPSTATGTIQFSIDGAAAGSPVTIIGGYAPITLSTLSAGTHQITATYSGDTNDVSSTSAVLTQTVNQVITTTGISSSPNPSSAGQSIIFTASVSSSIATGSVQFFIDGSAAGSPIILTGTQATYTTSTLSAGTHQITATYSGDTNDVSSTSAVLTQTVNQIIINTPPPTATQAINNLIITVNNIGLNHGQTDKLDNYLVTTINYLNTGSKSMAVSQLNSFISNVNTLSFNKQLTTVQASQLITPAQSIITTLSIVK